MEKKIRIYKTYCFSGILVLLFLFSLSVSKAQEQAPADSISVDTTGETAVIEEVIREKSAPANEKVEYISQLTKYGFKNLFSKYSFNPALPYSSQVNPFAEAYMQDYLRDHSAYLVKMKGWGMPYFNLIDQIFRQYGLPSELKYLAVIESSLSTAATSNVGAGGPWQFMPYTARDYGLVVTTNYDERRDYIKSTNAAARYLLNLYQQMHDWLLVIAAYNGGPGTVYNAMKRSGSRDFWKLQYYLPEESRNHVKKFIATHYVMETNAGNLLAGGGKGFYQPGGMGNPYTSEAKLSEKELAASQVITLSGKYIATVIAKNISMTMAEFNKYNPDFDSRISANGQYEFRLPTDKMEVFLANRYSILNECVQMMLGDDTQIPNNKTVYPSHPKSKNRKYRQ